MAAWSPKKDGRKELSNSCCGSNSHVVKITNTSWKSSKLENQEKHIEKNMDKKRGTECSDVLIEIP